MLIISLTAVGLILLAASINALVSLAKSAKHEITRLSAGEAEKTFTLKESGTYAIWGIGKQPSADVFEKLHPTICLAFTKEEVFLKKSATQMSVTRGRNSKTELFTFKAAPGSYILKAECEATDTHLTLTKGWRLGSSALGVIGTVLGIGFLLSALFLTLGISR